MARIRTTKPEFFTSEQVMNLSIVARFAFLGMWNFCDDGGNHPASPKTLKAEVFPSDDVTSTDVQAYVDEMIGQGLIAPYEAGGKQYWHVTGWHHQRIDKPTMKHPPYPGISPTTPPLVVDDSPATPPALADHSESATGGLTPGVEGIGMEGIGIGIGIDDFRLGADAPPADRPPKPEKQKSAQQEKPKTQDTWEAYSAAYTERYGVAPVRNAKVSGQLARLLERVPVEEAPSIAGFYVRSEDRFYVGAMHSVDLLLRDAEKLRTATITGRDVGATSKRHAGFDKLKYREGVNPDGSFE